MMVILEKGLQVSGWCGFSDRSRWPKFMEVFEIAVEFDDLIEFRD
jgi:hypothetical protein